MTKLQLLHRALNERLMAAVEQIMEMVGGTVLEYEEETIRVRKENEVLRRRLRWMEGANPADWPGPSEPVTLSTPDESNPALQKECAVSFGYDQESELFVIKTEPADITDDPSLINPESSLTALPPGTDPGSANAIADSKIDCGLTDSVNWDSTTSYMAPLDSDPTSPTDIRRWRGGSKRQKSSFACPECGKMFGREQRLMFHMRAHSTERPYSQGANPRRKTCFSGDNKRKGKVRSLTQPSKSKIEDQDPDGLSAAESDHTNNDKDAKNSTVKPVPNKRRGGRTKMSRCTQCSRVFNRPCRLAVHMKTHAKRKPLTNLPNKEPSGRDEKREMQSRPVGGVVVTSARPKERKLADGLRSTLDKGVTGALPNLSVLQVYTDFASTAAPLVTTIGMSSEISLVDSAFGKVQAGSVLSYQQPGATTRNITRHQDAPPPPSLPLDGYSLDSSVCLIAHSKQGLLHMTSLAVTLETAHIIEQATRDQNTSLDWHSIRNPRVISSRFREVCHVEGQSTAEHLASRIYKGTHRKTFMKRGLEIESAAVEEYCLLREVNFYSCGVLIHPDAPWLGASPDGIVYDPTEHQPFGLVEIKCPNVKSFVDCPCLKLQNGRPELKQQHGYYWQVQGQMLISGLDWCDFVVYAQNDMMIQRIYKDSSIFKTIREKADYFFFYFYLPRSLEM